MSQSKNTKPNEDSTLETSSRNNLSASDPDSTPKKGSKYFSLFMLILAIIGVFVVGIVWYYL